MIKPIIDTGAFVALLSPKDQYHEWAKGVFSKLKPPFYTSEPVITEVCYLLPGTQQIVAFLEKIKAGIILIEFSLQENISAVQILMDRYQDQDIEMADATIIRMSELLDDCHVYTTDRTDFSFYRRFGRAVIPHTAPVC
jgi:predicted nucleic acid-binding protein